MTDEEFFKRRALTGRQQGVSTDTLSDEKYIKKLEYLQIKDQFENASNTKETRRLLRSINKQRKADGKKRVLGIWIGCRKHKSTTRLNWIYERIKIHAVAIMLLVVMFVLRDSVLPTITNITAVSVIKYCVSALRYILIVYAIWHFVLWPIRKQFKPTLCPKCKKGLVFFDGMESDSSGNGTTYTGSIGGTSVSISDGYGYTTEELYRKCAHCGEKFESSTWWTSFGLAMKLCDFIGKRIEAREDCKYKRKMKREAEKKTTLDEKKQAIKEKKEKELESLKKSLEDITKK